ncbi:unnamed protein product [Ectocarpus sp. CCAP 1310/34]|nr:unnamed protein product [Ectocarpus sp. CCAP 1310/34]
MRFNWISSGVAAASLLVFSALPAAAQFEIECIPDQYKEVAVGSGTIMIRLNTWKATVGEAETAVWSFDVINAVDGSNVIDYLYPFHIGQSGSDLYTISLMGGAGTEVIATVTAFDAAGNTDSCSFLMMLWPEGTPLPTDEPVSTPQPTPEPVAPTPAPIVPTPEPVVPGWVQTPVPAASTTPEPVVIPPTAGPSTVPATSPPVSPPSGEPSAAPVSPAPMEEPTSSPIAVSPATAQPVSPPEEEDDNNAEFVEAGSKTTVGVTATAYDDRPGESAGDVGCGEMGCLPDLAHDGVGEEDTESRWSCAEEIVPDGGQCEISFTFDSPQDITDVQVAFWKGDERTRTLKVKINGDKIGEYESYPGSTFNSFGIQENGVHTVTMESVGIDRDDWISLLEVRFMVDP